MKPFFFFFFALALLSACASAPICKARPCVPTHALAGRVDKNAAASAIKFIDAWTAAGADALVINIDS